MVVVVVIVAAVVIYTNESTKLYVINVIEKTSTAKKRSGTKHKSLVSISVDHGISRRKGGRRERVGEASSRGSSRGGLVGSSSIQYYRR